MRQRFGLVLAGLVFSFLYVCAGDSYASAADFSSIKAKAAYEGLYTCINNGSGAVPVGEALLAKSFNASDGAGGMLLGKGDGAAVKLPFGLTDATDNNTNCKQILFGFNTNISGDELNKGLLPTDIQDTTDKSKIKNYFAGSNGQGGSGTIGYKAEGAGNVASGQTTQQLKISFDDDLADICRDSSGKLASSSFVDIDSGKTFSSLVFPTVTKDSNGNWWVGDNSSNNAGINVPEPGSGDTSYYNFCDGSLITIQDNGSALSPYYTLYGSFVQYTDDGYGNLVPSYITIDEIISASGGSYNSNKCNTRLGTILSSTCVDGVVGDSADYEDWKFTWDSSYMNLITKVNSTTNSGYKLTKTSNYSDLALTSQEVYDLYTYYIKDVFEVPVVCEGEADYDLYSDKPSINWKKGISCKADTGAPGINQYPGNVYGVNDDYHFTKEVSLDDVINTLKTIDLAEVDSTEDGGTLDDSTISGGVTTGGAGTTEATCANSGGAMSLGWIVCPILSWLGEASSEVYTNYVEPSLQIEPKLFNVNSAGEGTDATREAWRVFRDIANICFVILLLIVIFSQLTGVGIDNYGIKRILPKLIVSAILINLSYYICLIAVDISNILGNGFQALFNNLPTGTPTLSIPDSSATLSTISTTAITGVAVLGALVAMTGAVWANPAILLSLLVAALGVVIAIFFLFILLAAREAVIIVLVVISPIAFACYMLPNTKKFFDRWVQMGKGLLLVYPIAGLLVGGGDFVSRLLLSAGFAGGGFVSALTAMIVGVLPIFFIPTVLKSSFAALGNLGAKISGFGDRFRGGVDRKIRNAEGYKNAQKMGLERRTRIKAGLDKNGNLTRSGERKANWARSRFGRLTGADKRQATYIAAAKKDISTGEQAEASLTGALATSGISSSANASDLEGGALGKGFEGGSENAYYGKQFLDAARSGSVTGMNAAIEAMRASNMKSKDIARLMRYAQNHGDFNSMKSDVKSAWMRDISKRYGNDFLATDFELSSFAQTGGTGNGGALGNYGDYARSGSIGMDDIKPEDIGRLSSDSLAGLARDGGLINQTLAQRAISANPNLSVDKKIMLGAIANGATVNNVEDFKNEAKKLMNAKDSDFANGMTIGGITVDKTMRDAWASVTPESVNVVQNFHGGGEQFNPVDVNIKH